MLVQLRHRLLNPNLSSLLNFPSPNPHKSPPFSLSLRASISQKTNSRTASADDPSKPAAAASEAAHFARTMLFVPSGIEPNDVTEDMVLPGSNIVVGPYAGDAKIKEVNFVKSSNRPKECPRDDRPEFAMLGRSNIGKSSLINSLVRKKEVALTSKKPGKTQLINHYLVNKSWYIVDLPGYGFANAPESARMDWSSFTKGYFLNRETLVSVLLLVDASVPPQKIDLDCANWLGRNNIPMTFVFTKCDKLKGGKKVKRPDENIRDFQQLIRENYRQHPPWIMTSSVTGCHGELVVLCLVAHRAASSPV
ncbi:P-loop containing nucleoside triphosphate hydrolases superfamily protein [Perilla frutescens var. frutescens]|nr:P-loop containing nucleoside triphosphate hydrolases superfamily protein [Perilla frutescens var. frutescens]